MHCFLLQRENAKANNPANKERENRELRKEMVAMAEQHRIRLADMRRESDKTEAASETKKRKKTTAASRRNKKKKKQAVTPAVTPEPSLEEDDEQDDQQLLVSVT